MYRLWLYPVMIDGSQFPFEKNIEITADVVNMLIQVVTVEGTGNPRWAEDHAGGKTSMYDPNKVCEFIEGAGVDCLAISYGTPTGLLKAKM